MAAPTVYKSTDPNAPVLCGTNTSLVSVIRACLVDGYGTKAPAGWTLEFINAGGTIAAFRNNPLTGTGFFMQVDALNYDAKYPIVRTYEVMTSEVDGLFNIQNFGGTTATYISTATGTTARPWVVIANDLFVYFFCYPGVTEFPSTPNQVFNANRSLCFLVGDFEPNYATDGFNFYAGGTYDTSNGSFGAGWSADSTGNGYQAVARDITGTTKKNVCTSVSPPGGAKNYAFGCSMSNSPYTPELGILMSKVMINDGVANSIRGWFPYALAPLVYHPYSNLQEVTIDGKNYMYVMWRQYSAEVQGLAGLLFILSN